jgi:cytochrome d ubiquinol oxidase subunit II
VEGVVRRHDRRRVGGARVPLGVAFANIVQGVPLDADHNYTGTLFDLLNPYALLGGLTTLLLFFTHGVVFVSLKTEGDLRSARAGSPAGRVSRRSWSPRSSCSGPASRRHAVVLDPRGGRGVALIAGWLANRRGAEGVAFTMLAVTIAAAVFALFASLFPDVMPASNDPANSLTVANASSTDYTLTVMSWLALVALPLVLAYQGWTYWVFRKRVTRAGIEAAVH